MSDQPVPPRSQEPPTPRVPDNRQGTPCDICGYPTLGLHCKLKCENCGAARDCSDL